ncbi:MAG: transporter [Xanthomonadales bacterium]|nr:transporter [Xanthomonadales bacterium]
MTIQLIKNISGFKRSAITLVLAMFASPVALAQDAASAEELAKQLSNPIASLISVPLQLNYDSNIGSDDKGEKFVLNIQPVIPISLNEDWNVISRTILPVVSQDDIFAGVGSQFGIGDIVQSVFFSPKEPTSKGWVWGAGPVFLLPTATDDLLGAEKWGVGPTAVVLKQNGPWTYGALGNHLWSVAGDSNRGDINATFLQPFLSYTTPKAVTFGLNTETTYDWESEQWAVPLNLTVTKVTRIGNQLVSVGGGVRYWVESTDNGAEGFAVRLMFTLLYPK